jgi:Protein of unknown function (DUF3591)
MSKLKNRNPEFEEEKSRLKEFSLPKISHPNAQNEVYRKTYLYYASNKDFYEKMVAYVNYHDGTADNHDFEKNCSLPSFQGRELAEMCS